MPMRKIFTLQSFISLIHPDHTIKQLTIDSELIEKPLFKAPGYCVENIMNFARSYRVENSKSTGKVEMNLN
jgi:hypothetical protein